MAGTDYRVEARAVWERGVRSDVAMQAEIEAAIAAAEERGRRRGVEERDNALKAAHDYCLYMFKRQWLTDERNRSIFAAHIFAILDAALAPRDSAPKRHRCMRCKTEFTCKAPGCVALYDVLPTAPEHECKSRYPRQANNPSPSQNE